MEITKAKQIIIDRYNFPETQNAFNLAGYLAEELKQPFPISESEAEQMIIAAAEGKEYQLERVVDSPKRIKKSPLLERLKNKKIGEIVSMARRKHNGRKYVSYVVQSDEQLNIGDIVINPGRNGSTVWMEVVSNEGMFYDCKPI